MVPPSSSVIEPDSDHHKVYRKLYDEYKKLVKTFGKDKNSVMKNLRILKKQPTE